MIFDGDRGELGRYVRHLADLMGLRDWYLRLGDEAPEDEDWDGQCHVVYGRKVATISFRGGWEAWEPERLRWVAAHELIHCHVEPTRWSINNFKHAVGGDMYNVIYDAFTDDIEVAVDGMAQAWAEFLPLPVKE